MTVRKLRTGGVRLEALVAQDRDLLKSLAQEALEQVMQAEMAEFLGAAAGERSEQRRGYRAGYYSHYSRGLWRSDRPPPAPRPCPSDHR